MKFDVLIGVSTLNLAVQKGFNSPRSKGAVSRYYGWYIHTIRMLCQAGTHSTLHPDGTCRAEYNKRV